MSADNFASGLLGAAIGAAGAVLSTIFTIRHESQKAEAERKAEREKDLKNVVTRYLSLSQDAAESLWYIIRDIYNEKGPIYGGPEYYYSIRVMAYTLGRFFAVRQIMTLEGAYSNIEVFYPYMPDTDTGVGVYLRDQFENIGRTIDEMIEDIDKLQKKDAQDELKNKLSRHIRQQLAEAVMRREEGQWIVITLLDFEKMNQSHDSAAYLAPLTNWVEDDFVSPLRRSLKAKNKRSEKPLAVEDSRDQREAAIVLPAFLRIMWKLQDMSDVLSKITGLPPLPVQHRL